MSFFGGRRQHEDTEKAATAKKPAPPPAPRQPVGFETVIGSTTTLNGDIHSKGNMRLDGVFEGTLEIDGNILIGETAKINADINARNISIAGAVRGNVNGNKVQILRTGRVWGDINAAAITTEEGAFIDGKITMVSHEAALQSFEAAPLPTQEETLEEPDFLAALDDSEPEAAGEELEDFMPAEDETGEPAASADILFADEVIEEIPSEDDEAPGEDTPEDDLPDDEDMLG